VWILLPAISVACILSNSHSENLIRLAEQDNGRAVKLETGDLLELSLEGNPSTGYSWLVGCIDLQVLTPAGETKFEPHKTGKGTPGIVVLRFKAVRDGKTALKLVYRRPFEEDKAPLRTFKINVTVKNR
jgi:inhibitor of cysteine peptidase